MRESPSERKLVAMYQSNFPLPRKKKVYFAKVLACFFFMVYPMNNF